eukprot:scaffold70274_cov66-Phaeocystis_antarctica.AAC.6
MAAAAGKALDDLQEAPPLPGHTLLPHHREQRLQPGDGLAVLGAAEQQRVVGAAVRHETRRFHLVHHLLSLEWAAALEACVHERGVERAVGRRLETLTVAEDVDRLLELAVCRESRVEVGRLHARGDHGVVRWSVGSDARVLHDPEHGERPTRLAAPAARLDQARVQCGGGAHAGCREQLKRVEGKLDLARAAAGLHERGERARAGILPQLLPQLGHELEGPLHLERAAARVDERGVANGVGGALIQRHEAQHVEGPLEVAALGAHVEEAVEGDHVGLDAGVEHAAKHLEGLVDGELLAARTDEHGVRRHVSVAHVEGRSARHHLLEHE